MSKKAVGSKKATRNPYPVKTIIIGFAVLFGFSACESFKNREEPAPEPVVTAPVLVPTAYPIPSEGAKTKLGETRSEAEERYLQYARPQAALGQTDKELLDTGYALCGYFKESSNRVSLFEKIDAASNENRGKLLYLTNLSDYASTTLCPEFSNFE